MTLADASQGGVPFGAMSRSMSAPQILGAFLGVAVAHVMFDKPVFFAPTHDRSGVSQMVSEFVATFGLLAVIWGCARRRSEAVPFAVGAYITAAYWFTSSTSFANPAVTLARAASDTFAGIRPVDVPGFVAAQLLGAAAATAMFRWLVSSLLSVASRVVDRPGSGRGAHVKTVLFACVHTAGRSQMAAALFTTLADPRAARALSAGTQAGQRVHPEVVEVMREEGLDPRGASFRGSSRTTSRLSGRARDHGMRRGVPRRARSRAAIRN